jgi:hypothetical protein
MFDTARQLHFTRSLQHFSARLEDLLERARLYQPPLPPELIDEIAFTTGELMLVLTNYPSHEKEALVQEALSHAQSLRVRLRADQSQSDQVTKDCDDFSREIARLVIISQKPPDQHGRNICVAGNILRQASRAQIFLMRRVERGSRRTSPGPPCYSCLIF